MLRSALACRTHACSFVARRSAAWSNALLPTQRRRHVSSASAAATPPCVCAAKTWQSRRHFCSTVEEAKEEAEYHSIISNKERGRGKTAQQEFQAETRQLLDIVAKSLYSEREVFIRELISNSSDALEKLRYVMTTGEADVFMPETPLEIHLQTDDAKKTFTIQDTGVGMNFEELSKNLGTIARSGSKDFLKEMNKESDIGSNIIGQFGVGFYASFMVAEKVDVFTRSYLPDAQCFKWSSDGLGTYEIGEAENVDRGTKIVLHLKGDAYDFAKEEVIDTVIRKYSNFVGVPIYLNGKRVNVIEPLWLQDASKVTAEDHEQFYRFITNFYGRPRFTFAYKTDAPINIRALLYVPDHKPSMLDMSRETDSGVALYSRKVMVISRATSILPKWLRFMHGVVDSEDIPLNLSRELLQNSALIRKLSQVLTSRLLKFFTERAKKDPEGFRAFYEDYGLFFKEGIVTTGEQAMREDIAKLLRFESSALPAGEVTSLPEYASRMKAGERNIFFLSAPSREIAETSPYFEAIKRKLGDDVEVLFLYEPYDELVLMQMQQFDRKNLRSIEGEAVDDSANTNTVDTSDPESITQEQADQLTAWLEATLGTRVKKATVTNRLTSHPCVVSIKELGAVRHFMRTSLADKTPEEKFKLMEPVLEINPRHPIIRKLCTVRESDPELAKMVSNQLFDNAITAAGLMDDARLMVTRINDLLAKALEKW